MPPMSLKNSFKLISPLWARGATEDELAAEIGVQLSMALCLSPALEALLSALAHFELPDREGISDLGTESIESVWCPCGVMISQSKSDGSGEHEHFQHSCALTVLRKSIEVMKG